MNRRLMIAAVLVALLAAACGSDTTADNTTGATDAPSAQTLPPNPAAGACLAGAPDCQDIPGSEPEPLLVEGESDGGISPGLSGMVVGGGLSVSEAISTDAEGVLAVQGFVVSDASGIRLCEALAESMPPQCGGASLTLSSLDSVDPDSLQESQGVSWTDAAVTILGEVVDGTLVATPLSA